jgi:hypothetical protein
MKTLINCEILSSNLLWRACSGLLIAAGGDPENCTGRKPAMNIQWKKSTNESKGKPEQKFDAAFGTYF